MHVVQSLKSSASSALRDSSIYARLKNSFVQDLYWRVRNRQLIDMRKRQVEFYRDLLRGFRTGYVVFDIGANVGQKTDTFLRLGAAVVAVEPDEHNQEVLRGKFIKYRLSRKPISIVGKAVSDKIAVETFWVDGPGSALNTLSRKWVDTLTGDKERFDRTFDRLEFAEKRSVETTTIEQLIAEQGRPFFVKIDVEGHELSVVKGMRSPVPYLSYEVNLPEFRQEGVECLNVLQSLASGGECNYTSDTDLGLALQRWVGPEELARIINSCEESCIEVFWRSSSILDRD
jgi:FkbM family methyltransferase